MNSRIDINRLKKRPQFQAVARGRKWATPGLVLQASPSVEISSVASNIPGTRAGFTVTKKVGNAVVRNRARRRLREAAREVLPLLARDGYDYVLVGRSGTLDRAWPDLLDDLRLALAKVHGSRDISTSTSRSPS